VLCAYTGYLRSRDGWTASDLAGDALEPRGWIWTPPASAQDSGAAREERDKAETADDAGGLRLR
jgi:hypothetical protein